MTNISSVRFYHVMSVIHSARGHDTSRHALLIRVEHASGAMGWGEAAPLEGTGTETWNEMIAEVDCARSGDLDSLGSPSLRFGFESALMPGPDWAAGGSGSGKADGESASGRRPGSGRGQRVPSAALLGAEDAPGMVSAYASVKVKIGDESVDGELRRIQRILDGIDGKLRLDANRAFSFDDACRLLEALDQEKRIEFVEEPLREPDRLPHLADRFAIPLALDESVLEASDRTSLLETGFIIVVKPSLLGGLTETLDLMQRAAAKGVELVLSSAYETAIGMTHLVNLAALNGGRPAGFDTLRRVQTPGMTVPDGLVGTFLTIPSAWPDMVLERFEDMS